MAIAHRPAHRPPIDRSIPAAAQRARRPARVTETRGAGEAAGAPGAGPRGPDPGPSRCRPWNRPRRSLGRGTRWGTRRELPPPPSASAARLPPGARSRRSSPELYTLAAARDGLGPAGAFGGKPVKIAEISPSSELRGISLSPQGSFSRLGKRLCFFEKIPVLETFLRKPEGSGKTHTHRARAGHSPYPSHRPVQGKHVHALPPNPPPLLLNSTIALGTKPPPWQMPPQKPAWLGCEAVAPLSPCPSLSRSSNCCCIYPN
ncbi:uncharacterized protein LOC115349043 [Aquila chrysaetos chrysaetos]|uniref:uncharacterized protein LOC115349043 n=1 Tax=Aquila chrysaetos chrysaetos TaxID=223781 RepID=UPI001176FDE5|nr:uncharacterized protein LOC115349043 [Aquila chrysaetos chrysaetos]